MEGQLTSKGRTNKAGAFEREEYGLKRTLAETVCPPSYDKPILEYSQKIFHESYLATELLFVREDPPKDNCKTINTFRFLPERSGAPQGRGLTIVFD